MSASNEQLSIIVVSASSDIGCEMALRWAGQGHRVTGTFRSSGERVTRLQNLGVAMLPCDLADPDSLATLARQVPPWDVLLICPGTLEPIGPFESVSFPQWRASIEANFTSQLELLHLLLPQRKKGSRNGPAVIFFAGGGTNGAPVNYSAYTVAKIALIKMVELLDAEMPDTRFSIVGPGWVDTKIHLQTLQAGDRAGQAYPQTMQKLKDKGAFTSLDDIHDCLDWIIRSRRGVTGGRNFSVVHDKWGREELETQLASDTDMYKLRRNKN